MDHRLRRLGIPPISTMARRADGSAIRSIAIEVTQAALSNLKRLNQAASAGGLFRLECHRWSYYRDVRFRVAT
jgi:hypothetical protein